MLDDILTKTFYSNTIWQWLLAFCIIVGSIVAAKFLYWFSSTILKRLASKTKTRLDDILVDKLEQPLLFALLLLGIWQSLKVLTIPTPAFDFINRIYYVLIIFDITWALTRLVDALIQEYIMPLVEKTESTVDDMLLPIVRKGLKITIWTVAFIVALNNAGYDVGALIAGLGIGGLAFALAAQDTVTNIFGGFTIFLDKNFIIGDRVKIGDYEGFITEIGVRSVSMRTLDGSIVIIPNKVVVGNAVENISESITRKRKTTIHLSPKHAHEQTDKAIELLTEILENEQEIAERTSVSDITPSNKSYLILCQGLKEHSVDIKVVYFLAEQSHEINYPIIESRINQKIIKTLGENNIIQTVPFQFTEIRPKD